MMVIGDRQFAEDRRLLGEIADTGARTAVHRLVADVQVVDQYATLVCLNQADDHIEASGLAGTVGAKQGRRSGRCPIDRLTSRTT